MRPTDKEIAWAAGVIDGEGCFYINRQKVSTRPDLRHDGFRLNIKVTMGCIDTVTRLRDIFDAGTIQDHEIADDRINNSFSWILQAKQCRRAIALIDPYLFTKRSEIELAKHYLSLPRHRYVTQATRREHLRCYWRLRMAKPRWRFYELNLTDHERAEIESIGL